MREEICVPSMGESITEAEVSNILKPSGSSVQESEEMIELETEKVNQILYAPAAGVVTWTVEEGDTVAIGDVIGSLDSEGVATTKEEKKQQPAAPTPIPEPEVGGGARLMKGEFLADLEKKPKPKPKEEPPKPTTPLAEALETRTRMSKIRRTIANRLVEALHTAAMLTTFNEVDMSAIIAMRKTYQEDFIKKQGIKLGFMSFFVKAIVEALKDFPAFNSYLDGEDVVHREYYDVGIAVGTDRGLIVPVVRGCDRLSFAQIEQQIIDYATKAREGGLSIADLEGGGFTITNGGVYGSLLSTPILNPPQVGILGMHKIMERPIVEGGEVVIRPMMYLALSYDHRIVDGKEAVTFLIRLKEILEDPKRLLFFGG